MFEMISFEDHILNVGTINDKNSTLGIAPTGARGEFLDRPKTLKLGGPEGTASDVQSS